MIYLVGNRDLDVCKIGFSDRPKRRIKTIASYVPFEIEIFDIISGDHKKEKEMHILNEQSKIKGEWFVLSEVLSNWRVEGLETFDFLGQSILKYDDSYVYMQSAIRVLNKIRVDNGEDLPFNFYQFINSSSIKSFIDEVKRKKNKDLIIQKHFGKIIHSLLFVEMCRVAHVKTKIEAYDSILRARELDYSLL